MRARQAKLKLQQLIDSSDADSGWAGWAESALQVGNRNPTQLSLLPPSKICFFQFLLC